MPGPKPLFFHSHCIPFIIFRPNIKGFEELHSAGLLYVEVPVSAEDHFQVPVLDGFVMNRLAGDYIESLLYKVFSTLTSQTVKDLSELLDENLEAR